MPCHKIRTVSEKVEVDDSLEDDFAPIFGLAEMEEAFMVNPQAVVYANEVFERLKAAGRSLGDVSADPVDYRARLREALFAELLGELDTLLQRAEALPTALGTAEAITRRRRL